MNTQHELLDAVYRTTVRPTHELRGEGMTEASLRNAVAAGVLLRVRRGWYAVPDAHPAVLAAVRAGGRAGCTTLLRMLHVFVLASEGLHVHMPCNMSRHGRRIGDGLVLHWVDADGGEQAEHAVPLADAVLQATLCQRPRAAIATLDSILNSGLMTRDQLDKLFREAPRRCRVLLPLVDGSAGSGPETFVRLLLRALGLPFETQVWIAGVGRVDFLVDGWLIIECDSERFHAGWEKQKQDRARDIAAARRGYVTMRPIAEDILLRGDQVRAEIAGVFDAFSGVLGERQLRRNSV